MHLAKGTKVSGVEVRTERGQTLAMWDRPAPDGILLEDKNKMLSLQFNSQESIIKLKNKSGPEIVIDCSSGRVSVQGGSVEVTGGQVDINGSGKVKVASGGKVEIEAPAIDATAAGAIKLSAPDITLEGAKITLNAPLVNAASILQAGVTVTAPLLTASTSVVSPAYTPGVGNVM